MSDVPVCAQYQSVDTWTAGQIVLIVIQQLDICGEGRLVTQYYNYQNHTCNAGGGELVQIL